MTPFETFMIPTAGTVGKIRQAYPAEVLAAQVTKHYETVVERGGKVVAHHMVDAVHRGEQIERVATSIGRSYTHLMPHIMIVAEFPETDEPTTQEDNKSAAPSIIVAELPEMNEPTSQGTNRAEASTRIVVESPKASSRPKEPYHEQLYYGATID